MKIIIFVVIIFSWSVFAGENLEVRPLKLSGAAIDGSLFELLPGSKTGIDHTTPIDADHPLSRVLYSSSAGSGIAIGDINLDGKLDFFAASGPRENSLYLGNPDGTGLEFTNVAAEMGVAGEYLDWAVGVAMIDLDNDGDLDIYVCNYDRPNQLFLNQLITNGKRGEFKFVESAKEWRADMVDGCIMPAFADYDRDGDLDLYVLTHQVYREDGRPPEPIELEIKKGKRVIAEKWERYFKLDEADETIEKVERFEYSEVGRPDYLLRNDGGRFTNVSRPAGINLEGHWGNSATWWDFNHDDWPDLYVGNDFSSPDFLYRNNGDGTFTEVSKQQLRHTTKFSRGATQTDLNNDGWIDFVAADILPASHYKQKTSMGSMGARQDELQFVDGARQLMRNAVHINTGTDHFLEGSWLTGMATTESAWAIRSQDFNNDGLTDVFFTNGIPRQFNHSDHPALGHDDLVGRSHWSHYKDAPIRREVNQVYQNHGDLKFSEVGRKWGLDHRGISSGASTADFDGDGQLEILVANLEDPLSFYHNKGTGGNRVVFDLIGKRSNRNGIGATVTLKTGNETMMRQLFPSGGYLDGDDSVVHFGLGNRSRIDSATIHWPSGLNQTFTNLEVNQHYTATEPDEVAIRSTPVKSRNPEKPMFSKARVLEDVTHSETIYDDFLRQPLLPFKLSQMGPGQAWADIDGDDDPDFFLGGAGGQPAQLFINETPSGSKKLVMIPVKVEAFESDVLHEDMGCLFFDADGDGDLDLYVASGGVECSSGDIKLQDRLYLNKGNTNFERASRNVLPNIRQSSGTVTAADFDHDGDLDLFVGSRSVPGQYPITPENTLLRNDDGKFIIVTPEAAPELTGIGMVTSALWSDIDSDGWADLLVTLDWGKVKVFRNNLGKLSLAADTETGFGNLNGWYNGIAGGDVDQDGDIDFVVTNLGPNTQYQASRTMPRMMFYGDFEGNGQFNIVEAMFEQNKAGEKVPVPFRGLNDTSRAIPVVGKKFTTSEAFARARLPEVYPLEQLNESLSLVATNFENLVMINDGSGKFTTRPLPRITGISPGFGVTLNDIDLDGILDCVIAQNFFTAQPKTGAFDSGLSILLRGTGNSENPFIPVGPKESGILIPGDAKSVTSVDINLDGAIDLVFGQNNDKPVVLLNETENEDYHPLRIRLTGTKGNPNCIGAKLNVVGAGMIPQTREVSAGGGYLSQQSSDQYFAIPKSLDAKKIFINVTWPDGGTSQIEADAKSRFLSLSRR